MRLPLTLSALLFALPALAQQKPNQTLVKHLSKLPLSFEKNIGQTDKQVKFLSRGKGYSLFLTPKESVFSLKGAILRMQLVGANAFATETTQAKLSGTTNYFVGKDKSQWRTGVENYSKVGFKGVYKGIDVVYYGNQNQLEYDFIVKPTSDPKSIHLKFAGAKRVKALSSGDLLLETGNGSMKWHAPVAYQEANGKRKQVSAKYKIVKGNEVCFAVGDYDRSKPLVIDPVLAYSTYLGGNSNDFAFAVAVDSNGFAYVTGSSASKDFPVTAGAFQTVLGTTSGDIPYQGNVFVTKVSPDGTSLIYSTYLGGKSSDWAGAIAVDDLGSAYITGTAYSTNFPTTKGAFQTQGGECAFVTKLSPAGDSLVYSTYLGGGYTFGTGIAVDKEYNVYLTGEAGIHFPTTQGAFQTTTKTYPAFVTKLNKSGSALIYSTLLGGSGFGLGSAIAINGQGNAYVTGYTEANDFPTTPGAFQRTFPGGWHIFFSVINPDGKSLNYSTLFAGDGVDWARCITRDSEGSTYIGGTTSSTDLPVTSNAFQKTNLSHSGLLLKFNANNTLTYTSYFPGEIESLQADSNGNLYLIGYATYLDFPSTGGALQEYVPSNSNYVAKLGVASNTLFYGSAFGDRGTGIQISLWDITRRGVALGSDGGVYLAGTNGFDYLIPTSQGAFQTQRQGVNDGFAAKLNLPRSVVQLPYRGLFGGKAFKGTVTLDAPVTQKLVLKLMTDNALVTIPSSVTFAKGTNTATFNIVTAKTKVDTEVHIATGENLGFARLYVLAPKALNTITAPPSMVFGTTATGTITLKGLAPDEGIVVNLTTDNPAITVPASVTVSALTNSITFPIVAGNVTTQTVATITAQYGTSTLHKIVNVYPAGVGGLTLSKGSVKGGEALTGTVTVKGVVPTKGMVIKLTSSDASVQVPSTVVVKANQTSVDFAITTNKVSNGITVIIRAQFANTSAQAYLNVNH